MKKQLPQTITSTTDKLGLKKETLRKLSEETLSPDQLREVAGGIRCPTQGTSSIP